MRYFVGIDNGCTGSLGIISDKGVEFYKTPVKKEQNYTKKKANVSRIDVVQLQDILSGLANPHALIERPMVNPRMFQATLSAVRALEATLNVIELLGIPYEYIDSKEWQKELLPKGTKGKEDLKKASLDIGSRLFPQFKEDFEKQKDADGMLIAEYCRRKYK